MRKKIRRALCRGAGYHSTTQCRETAPQRIKVGAQRCVVLRVGAFARDQQDVDDGQVRADLAEALARDAFDAVAAYSIGRNAPRHREAETRRRSGARRSLCVEMPHADALAGLTQPQEIAGFYDAGRVREACAAHREGIARDGQTETARRLRPLARRAFSTLRPPRVFMRERKP